MCFLCHACFLPVSYHKFITCVCFMCHACFLCHITYAICTSICHACSVCHIIINFSPVLYVLHVSCMLRVSYHHKFSILCFMYFMCHACFVLYVPYHHKFSTCAVGASCDTRASFLCHIISSLPVLYVLHVLSVLHVLHGRIVGLLGLVL